jgi:hypothetical protein
MRDLTVPDQQIFFCRGGTGTIVVSDSSNDYTWAVANSAGWVATSVITRLGNGSVIGRGGAEHINRSSAEGGLLPAGVYFPRNRRET